MAILSDKWIRTQALEHGMIEPFVEAQRRDGCISYGLSLCAETVAVAKIMSDGGRGGLIAVAVIGGAPGARSEATPGAEPVSPCGRCRQILNEIAQLGGTDPVVLCIGANEVVETTLAALLPLAFGPASLTLAESLG